MKRNKKITVTINVQWNYSLFSQWPSDKQKSWVAEMKKKTGKKLKEEDANLKSETGSVA